MKNKFTKIGFTLIEVLITISIIGLLAALTLVSFGGSQKGARDTQRKSDMRQYATAIENYANVNNSLYPAYSNTVQAKDILCPKLGITSCPEDPKNASDPSTNVYFYQSDGGTTGSASATKFFVWARLEKTTDNWILCSNGKVGTKPQSQGLTGLVGACPL